MRFLTSCGLTYIALLIESTRAARSWNKLLSCPYTREHEATDTSIEIDAVMDTFHIPSEEIS